MTRHHPDQIRAFITQTCQSLGSQQTEAELVANNLVEANLAGHDSHGVGMLPTYVDGVVNGRLKINVGPVVVVDRGPLVTLDGQAGFGQVNGFETMKIGIERAQNHGVAIVGLRNSYHIGRIGRVL